MNAILLAAGLVPLWWPDPLPPPHPKCSCPLECPDSELESLEFELDGVLQVCAGTTAEGPACRLSDSLQLVGLGPVREGRRNGLWYEWDEAGRPLAAGPFQAGRVHGLWLTWHENGVLSGSGWWAHGVQSGPWQTWTEDGRLIATGSKLDGDSVGDFRSYFPSGALRVEGQYAAGQRTGEWTWYNEDGSLFKVGSFVAVEHRGLGRWPSHGSRSGAWRFYDHRGLLQAAGEYGDGQPIGAWEFGDPLSGHIRARGHFERGPRGRSVPHGRWDFWSVAGEQTASGAFLLGQPDGEWSLEDQRHGRMTRLVFQNGVALGSPSTPAPEGAGRRIEQLMNDTLAPLRSTGNQTTKGASAVTARGTAAAPP